MSRFGTDKSWSAEKAIVFSSSFDFSRRSRRSMTMRPTLAIPHHDRYVSVMAKIDYPTDSRSEARGLPTPREFWICVLLVLLPFLIGVASVVRLFS